ncbi:MAG: VWA domain-containing protein [Alphaproteobacteria bacterium]|nr:VWA domain-containing protein [Alphaproteobacteria bacterium]
MNRLRFVISGLILGLMGLASPLLAQTAPPSAGSTILVLDASGSMWGQIDGKAKITIAQEVVGELLKTIPEDQSLGLTVYGHRRKGDCGDIENMVLPALNTRQAIAKAVNSIKPKGKTPLSAAVIEAAETLKFTEQKATVILISDGRETCNFNPCDVGRRLKAAGVDFTAHVIGFDVANQSDRAQLQCLAENTGGIYRTASNAAELSEALKIVAAPPPPTESHIRFEAREKDDGPRLIDGLVWSLTNLDTGEMLADFTEASGLNLQLPPATYLVEVLRPADEAFSSAEVEVSPNSTATITMLLPVNLPPATINAPDSAFAGEKIAVSWSGPDGKADRLAIAGPNDPASVALTYTYTSTGSPTAITMPGAPGNYELRYVMTKRNVVIFRKSIEVTEVSAQLNAPSVAKIGQSIEVTWQGPGYDRDYISVAKQGSRDTKFIYYSNVQFGSPLRVQMPAEPGDYILRYMLNASPDEMLASANIRLESVSASVKSKASGMAGGKLIVNWQGPDYARDYIAIAPKGGGRYVTSIYTKYGSPLEIKLPKKPGQYEVWYVMKEGKTVLARQDLTLN